MGNLTPFSFSFRTYIKSIVLLPVFLQALFAKCDGVETRPINQDYFCEVYAPMEKIPPEFLEEAKQMYYEAFCHPPLHQGIAIAELGIDEKLFASYEDYIKNMFEADFTIYHHPEHLKIHYFQIRSTHDQQIVGFCVVIETSVPGHYYIDNLGINWMFRHQGLGGKLIEAILNQFDDFIEIALDTRVFNLPAQALYEKWGFQKLPFNPDPKKQTTYYHYILKKFRLK